MSHKNCVTQQTKIKIKIHINEYDKDIGAFSKTRLSDVPCAYYEEEDSERSLFILKKIQRRSFFIIE